MNKHILGIIVLFFVASLSSAQTVLIDDFNRADNNTIGNSWLESETNASGAQILSNQLRCGSTTQGREWVYRDVSANYTTNGISTNGALMTWAFNMRQTRTDPSGFGTGNYGIAFCLGSTSSNATTGNGYAVVIGESGATDAIRLARFTGGMDADANFTTIISGSDFGDEYISVRVTYDPSTNDWSLYAESNAAAFPQSDPRNTATQIGATTSNSTYTAVGTNLNNLGCMWNHATSGTDFAYFDDVYSPDGVQGPNVSFVLAGQTQTEGNTGTEAVIVEVTMQSAPPTNTVIAVTRTGGTATPGTDFAYTNTNLTFTPAASYPNTQSVTIDVIGDIAFEPDETVILALSVSSGSATLVDPLEYTLSIFNDDVSAMTFYSTASGSFTTTNIWNTEPDGSGASATYPTTTGGTDDVFFVQADHTITISTGDVTANGIKVFGTLNLNNTSSKININNTGDDPEFQVEGTFIDNASSANGVDFATNATWQLGSAGTIIKTNASSSANYANNYLGGISTIPASANWIIRFTTTGNNPSFNTVDMYYPNLIFESTNGAWDPATGASRFQGAAGTCIIKGNLDIGGGGSGTVKIYTQNTNATPITVQGLMDIQAGSTFTNNGSSAGTGVRVAGDISVLGTLDFAAGTGTNRGILEVNGDGTQTISGTGTINLRNMVVNKTGNAVLARNLTVNNQLTLTNGYLQLSNFDLTVRTTTSGGSNTTYVITDADGRLRQPVAGTEKNYPVGNSSYNPIKLTNTGTLDTFSVRVTDDVLTDGTSGSPLTDNVVDRTWHVEEVVEGGSDVLMNLEWQGTDEFPAFLRNSCYISFHDGTGWNDSAPGASNGSDPYTRTRSGLSLFNATPYALASSGVLPVEWSSFEAKAQNGTSLLRWATASERNSAYFAIERSTDGLLFAEIGRRKAAGYSATLNEYQFIDHTPSRGTNFYRLRQMDADGNATFSAVKNLEFEGKNGVFAFPQPAQQVLNLQFDVPISQVTQWQILDEAGRLVSNGTLPENVQMHPINLAQLPVGFYVLRMMGEHGATLLRFVKEN